MRRRGLAPVCKGWGLPLPVFQNGKHKNKSARIWLLPFQGKVILK